MASSSQTLTTNIVINATTGNSFTELGNTLTYLSSMVQGITNRLGEFGKKSMDYYRDYELSMKDTVSVLTKGAKDSSKEYTEAWEVMDKQARSWAASTIFHADDVGNAMLEAARAGWQMEDIFANMPAVMRLAEAGGLDLSEALNYVVRAMSANLGVSLDNVNEFIDMWAFAANSSAGSIDMFGETFLQMGSAVNFAGSTEELLALTAVMHNMGFTGSKAGTLLRNSLFRVMAPTKKATEALDSLKMSSQDAEEAMDGLSAEQLANHMTTLGEHGFKGVYDEQGNLRSFIEIYAEMGAAMADLAGGWDQIGRNDQTIQMLYDIFGMRSTQGALNIINGLESAKEIYDSLKGGEAEGYGVTLAENRMNTLYGSLEIYQSKVENLETAIGEKLAEQVRPLLETLGGIVDSMAGLSEGPMNALVTFAEILVAGGVSLGAAGTAFRFIGTFLRLAQTPKLLLTLPLIIGAIGAFNELSRANLEDKFGDLNVDGSEIDGFLTQLGDMFNEAYQEVNQFNSAIDQSIDNFANYSSEVKARLLQTLFTGGELTPEQEEEIANLGDKAAQELASSVQSGYGMTLSSLTGAFGEEGMATSLWDQIMAVLEAGYAQEQSRAEDLGRRLKDAIFTAFREGLTAENINAIQNVYDEMGEMIAQQQNRERYAEQQKMIRKAQTIGYEDFHELSEKVAGQRDEQIEQVREQQDRAMFDLMTWYDDAIAQGMMVEDEKGILRRVNEGDKNKAKEALEKAQQKQVDEIGDWYSGFLMNLWYTSLTESEYGGDYANLEKLAKKRREQGGLFEGDIAEYFGASGHISTDGNVLFEIQDWADAMGGWDEIARLAPRFKELSEDASLSDSDRANYASLAEMAENVVAVGETFTDAGGNIVTPQADLNAPLAESEGDELWAQLIAEEATQNTLSKAAEIVAGQSKLAPYGTDLEFMQGVLGRHGIDSTYIPETEEVEVNVGANTFEFESAMDSINAYNGDSVRIRVAGDTSDIEGDISRLQNKTIRLRIAGGGSMLGYAEGGRATSASVFGEAGPEWAIPEEHSARTAELLNSARQASGFTWPELLSRTGGFNADANHVTSTIIYSPTINAQDSRDVDQALREDKDRFERWFEQKKMLEEAMAF